MKSPATQEFWKLYKALPEDIQRRADNANQLWQIDPRAHSLYFKQVGKRQPIYSVRIGRGHRALGLLTGDAMLWFWIGTHDEYGRLLKQL